MLAILDAIGKEERERKQRTAYQRVCQGSTHRGHTRDYGDHTVFVPEHDQSAHIRTYLKRK